MLNPKVRKINLKEGGGAPGRNAGGSAEDETPTGGFGGWIPPKGKQPESARLKSGYELCDLRKLMNEHFLLWQLW